MSSISLFAYGTLMIPEIISELIGRSILGEPATLYGYRRNLIIDEAYPGILPQTNGVVTGIVYPNLKPGEIELLSHYEGHLYILSVVEVTLSDGSVLATQSYILRTEYHHLLSMQDWDLETFKRQSRRYF